MKKLIINADDFGASSDVDEGIIYGVRRGVITDVSILAVGDDYENAIKLAKNSGIDKIGIHLAVTGSFRPVNIAYKVRTLIDKEGYFCRSYVCFLKRYFSGFINMDELEREFRSQIERVKKSNFFITHLDSHQHIHMIPGILQIVLDLMQEEKISYIRYPKEEMGIFERIKNIRGHFRNMILRGVCVFSKRLLDKYEVKYTDFFIGHNRAHRLDKKYIFSKLDSLKNGITEFCTHPGYYKRYNNGFSQYKSRREELEIFCSKEFLERLEKNHIKLISF